MEILHELHQLDHGGVERVIRNIIKYDKENQHTIVAYKDGSFRKELEDVGATIKFPEQSVDMELSADIIHVHCGGAKSQIAQWLGKNFPVIETIHSPVKSPMDDNLIMQRVGVANAVTEMNNNCVTINNGLDLEVLEPTKTVAEIKAELGLEPEKVVIGRLGRLGMDKGLEDFILTCYALQNEGYDFIPLIVGAAATDCDAYVAKLKLMCKSLPLKNVVWAGFKEDTPNYFQVMDIFLYPSPTEGFGLVYAEAMHAGCLPVVYRNDITMQVCSGHSVLTKTNDIPGLVEAAKKALDLEVRNAYSGLGREYVRAEFEAERMSLDYQDLYKKVGSEWESRTS